MNVIHRKQDGSLEATGPFVVTCGCGGVVPDTRNAMRLAGIDHLPMIVSSSNMTVKMYLRQVGLTERVPSLNKSKHALLFNPQTGKYLDMYHAPLTQTFYDNLWRVANNG